MGRSFPSAGTSACRCARRTSGLTEETRDRSAEALVDEVYGKRWKVTNVPRYFSRETLINAIYYLDAYAAEHR